MTEPTLGKRRSSGAGVGAALVLLIIALTKFPSIVGDIHQEIDNAGWISHRAEIPVIFDNTNHEWITGEYRNCTTYRNLDPIECGIGNEQGGVPHVMPNLVSWPH